MSVSAQYAGPTTTMSTSLNAMTSVRDWGPAGGSQCRYATDAVGGGPSRLPLFERGCLGCQRS
ncbi:hypothetical protein DICSQDRAFT_141425 [Dichomitus squalens LYAD-421 SS1]|uniref:Uncharacterized protein n=1 Tax=Dichomitus squalens (strain LYAD-421) TaxID=732165 RepID=R7SJ62_DICSQ|nr:uncharacterized protein DICSQDRAFT_141425 [Dichomitus squalens LYAD-421 SS1]EJF56164.1 hypothetical protein DICSQDRAFT_141425 [Dichomitus squalens LYAD-421 SS1]